MTLKLIQDKIENGSIIHLSGLAGSGKTLLASAIAAKTSSYGHVDWVCTDGKTAFISYLKRNMPSFGGNPSNLTVTVVQGHERVRDVVLNSVDRLNDSSKLVVIDSITRVLDMSRDEEIMWGRELFEEVLPSLAGLAISKDICVLLVSEMRSGDTGTNPVHHGTIGTWLDLDLQLVRAGESNISKIFQIVKDEEPLLVGKMTMSKSGEILVDEILVEQEVKGCSENPCSV